MIRVSPTLLTAKAVEYSRAGRGIKVHSGAPGVRVYFDKPSESYKGENSYELVTGLCVPREFERLWLKAESATELADIMIEVLDCAPHYAATLGGARILYRREWSAQEFQNVEEESPFIETLVAAGDAWTEKRADYRVGFFDHWMLGGAVRCNKAFELRLWARIGASQRALIARLVVDVADPDDAASFSASLETGWKPTHDAAATVPAQNQGPLLPLSIPWELEITQPADETFEFSGVVYAYART
jgi:hypothetical protein